MASQVVRSLSHGITGHVFFYREHQLDEFIPISIRKQKYKSKENPEEIMNKTKQKSCKKPPQPIITTVFWSREIDP